MSDIPEKIYEYKEMKMKDLEKAIEHMNDKGYETAPLEELSTVYRPNGTPYCNFSVTETKLIISFLSGTMNGYKIHMDRGVIPVLKKFLDTLEVEIRNPSEGLEK